MNRFTKKAAGGANPFSQRDLLDRSHFGAGVKLPELDTSYLSRNVPPTAKLKPTLEDVIRSIVAANPNIDMGAVADALYDRGVTPYRIDEATLEELLYPSRPVQVDYDALPSSPNTYRLGKDGGLNRLAAIASGVPAVAQPEVDLSSVFDTALRQAAEEPGNNVASFSENALSPYMRAMASPYNSVVFPDMKLPKSIGNPIVRSAEELSRDNIDVSHAADALLGAPVEAEDIEGLLGQFASPRYKMKFNNESNLLPESLGEAPMGYYAPPEGTEWDRAQAALNIGRGLQPLPEDEDAGPAPAAEPVSSPLAETTAPARIGSPDLIPAGAPAVAQPGIDFAGATEPVSSPLAIDPEDNNLPEGAADPGVIPNIRNQDDEERRYVLRPGGTSSIVRPDIVPSGAPAAAQPEVNFAGADEPVVSPLAGDPAELEGQIPAPRYKMKFNTPNLLPESLGGPATIPDGLPPAEQPDIDFAGATEPVSSPLAIDPAELEGQIPSPRYKMKFNNDSNLLPLPESIGGQIPSPQSDMKFTVSPNSKTPDSIYTIGNLPADTPKSIGDGASLAGDWIGSELANNKQPEQNVEAPGLTLGDIEDNPRVLDPFTPVEAPSLANALGTQVLNQGPIHNFLDQLRAVENTPGSSLSDFPIR